MKNRRILVVLMMIFVFAMTACGKTDNKTYVGSGSNSDLEYVKQRGKLVVGITNFQPMDYQDENGEWIGYDADLARMFAKRIGVEAEFIEINWGNKNFELKSKKVDCVWNGMTLTPEVDEQMSCTEPYCKNAQVIILPKKIASEYKDVSDLRGLTFAVENGSAGQEVAKKYGLDYTMVPKQATALMEVDTKTSDGAIVDLLMARAMVGEGTSYDDLTIVFSLDEEDYVVGFRKGSDITNLANEFLQDASENGTVAELEEKYWNIKRKELSFADKFKIVFKALNAGFVQTMKLFVVTLLGAIPLGLIIQFAQRSKIKLISWLTNTIIWIVRGTPLMIQLLIIFYFPGYVFENNLWGGGANGRFVAAAVAFIINYACYFAVIFRGGIQSIPTGQDEAGFVLGMSRGQIFFKVKLLQMVKNVAAPMSNEILTLVKDTSLARIISMQEIVWAGESFLNGANQLPGIVWPLFFTAFYYLIFNGILTIVFARIEKKLSYFD